MRDIPTEFCDGGRMFWIAMIGCEFGFLVHVERWIFGS
jgi:hypothetical protein